MLHGRASIILALSDPTNTGKLGSGPINFDEMVEVIFGECQVSRHRSEGAGKCEHFAFGLFEWQAFATTQSPESARFGHQQATGFTLRRQTVQNGL